MSTDRDVARIVGSWLEEGATALPDRVVDAVLDQLPATPQRRAHGPARRWLDMNIPTRVAMAAAAVLALAVVGLVAFPKGAGVAGPGPATSPTPSASPTPSPIAFPVNPASLTVGVPGSYRAGAPFQVPTTLDVPAGWVIKVGGPYAAYLDRAPVGTGGASVSLTLSQAIYADPCHDRGLLSPQPGPTVDDLVTALASLPGFDATAASPVTIDGYSGRQLTLTAPASFAGCTLTQDGYRLWLLPLGGIYEFQPAQSTTVRIIDVNGRRLVVSSDTDPTTTAQERAEIQSLVDSIRIETGT